MAIPWLHQNEADRVPKDLKTKSNFIDPMTGESGVARVSDDSPW